MSTHPSVIKAFCASAVKNGTMDAVFAQARADLFADFTDSEDTLKRDQIWATFRALQKVEGLLQGYAIHEPEVI